MAKKTYSAAEIVSMLRQAEVHLSLGMTIAEAAKQLEMAITAQEILGGTLDDAIIDMENRLFHLYLIHFLFRA